MLADIQVKVIGIQHENLSLKEEIAQFKEAQGSFFGLRVEVLKLQSCIQDKPLSPSYYIIISTYDQS